MAFERGLRSFLGHLIIELLILEILESLLLVQDFVLTPDKGVDFPGDVPVDQGEYNDSTEGR